MSHHFHHVVPTQNCITKINIISIFFTPVSHKVSSTSCLYLLFLTSKEIEKKVSQVDELMPSNKPFSDDPPQNNICHCIPPTLSLPSYKMEVSDREIYHLSLYILFFFYRGNFSISDFFPNFHKLFSKRTTKLKVVSIFTSTWINNFHRVQARLKKSEQNSCNDSFFVCIFSWWRR